MASGRDFLILSTQDWDAMPTRKPRWARRWAQQGNRVLDVEQQMHWIGWLAAIRAEFGRVFRWLRGPRHADAEPNLWVFTLPIVLPFFQMSAAINWLNNLLLPQNLRCVCFLLAPPFGVRRTITPHSGDFI